MDESAGDAKLARVSEPANPSGLRCDAPGAGAMWFNRV